MTLLYETDIDSLKLIGKNRIKLEDTFIRSKK